MRIRLTFHPTISKDLAHLNNRVAMRPKLEPGSFHDGIVGQNFDPVDLTDPVKFVNFFHENIRKDVVFKKITGITYWKSVLRSFCGSYVYGDSSRASRPKMRMVNKFQEGRVFIAGGKRTTVPQAS